MYTNSFERSVIPQFDETKYLGMHLDEQHAQKHIKQLITEDGCETAGFIMVHRAPITSDFGE